jgi:uncharacterized iron-regulated membrane protein
VSRNNQLIVWARWFHQPQRVWLRRALFQVHLWSGIAMGLYILMISVTGSVLVYRNELMFRAKSPRDFQVIYGLADLHDNLFGGPTGRAINGLGALVILVVAASGLVIWWPGIKTWARSLLVPRGVGWRRTIWHLHSAVGFWTFAFTVVFAMSGLYLCFPESFQQLADRLDPSPIDAADRVSDQVIYWLAYLHFGRINGIGIPCHGPGLCDQATKATWALFGLAPAAMFVTGAIMWWSRLLGPRWRMLSRRNAGRSAEPAKSTANERL